MLHPDQHIATFVWIGLGLLLFILIVGSPLLALVRYPSETAVIRMVDEYEKTGIKVGFKQGWKLGWNRRAFRLWVIDLVVSLPVFLLLAVTGGLGLLVFFSVKSGTGSGHRDQCHRHHRLCLPVHLCLHRTDGPARPAAPVLYPEAALENTGIGRSFRSGWAMFKRNWKSAGLMWLVMLGIGIGVGIAGLIVFFLLIPAYLVMILPAAIVGAHPWFDRCRDLQPLHKQPWSGSWVLLAAMPLFLMVVLGSACRYQRLVYDLRLHRLDPDLPGDPGARECCCSGGGSTSSGKVIRSQYPFWLIFLMP